MGFNESFITQDGCRIRLLRGGSGEALLYLHGANGVTGPQPFMETLARGHDLWVPEHPGFGQSDEPGWLGNIHDLAYFYLDFLRAQKLSRVHVVGSSIGGWLALEMAVRDTSRMASLTLIGPSGIRAPGVQAGDIFLWSPEELVRNTFHDAALAQKVLAMPQTPEQQEIALKNRYTLARLAWEPRLYDPHLHKWLKRIDVPSLIVWGEEDRILPAAWAEAFRVAMPQAQIRLIPNCGHLPQTEKPAEFCDILQKFLARR